MRINQVPLDDLGGLGIFDVLPRASTLLPPEPNNFDQRHLAGTQTRAARRGWLDRLDHWFWKREQRANDAYLATSQDIHELEARMRRRERRDSGTGY